jgi:hypothetical protein
MANFMKCAIGKLRCRLVVVGLLLGHLHTVETDHSNFTYATEAGGRT